jgi:hypothetical protein
MYCLFLNKHLIVETMNYQIGNRCKILITKKIADSLSKSEEKELLQYMVSNKSAILYFTELKNVCDKIEILGLAAIIKNDKTEAWERLIKSLK